MRLWKQGTKKAGETRLSVRAEVQSSQYKGGEQPWNFLMALSAYLLKYHITMSNYSSFTPVCAWDTSLQQLLWGWHSLSGDQKVLVQLLQHHF